MPLASSPTKISGQSVLGASVTLTLFSFVDTGLTITLPGPGTYFVFGTLRGQVAITSGPDLSIVTKLRNVTDTADVSNTQRLIVYVGTSGLFVQGTTGFSHLVTVTGLKQINVYATLSSTGSPGGLSATFFSDSSGFSNLGYIKLA